MASPGVPEQADPGIREWADPGVPEWADLGVPEADAEPADAGVDHGAGPDEIEATGGDGDEGHHR